MAKFYRAGLLDLLGRLGSESDEAVLAAARELHRTVAETGLTWDDLLRANAADASADRDEGALDSASDPPAGIEPAIGGKAEVARQIERLLARASISDTLREELVDFKRAIAEGTFDDMDARYVRALAKRLGA